MHPEAAEFYCRKIAKDPNYFTRKVWLCAYCASSSFKKKDVRHHRGCTAPNLVRAETDVIGGVSIKFRDRLAGFDFIPCSCGTCGDRRIHFEKPETLRGPVHVKIPPGFDRSRKVYCSMECACYDKALKCETIKVDERSDDPFVEFGLFKFNSNERGF